MERLVSLLEKSYDGDPWHGPPLKSVLAGIGGKAAAARPVASAHTIWELVLHLNSWYREVERRVKGAAPGDPAEGDWPAPPDASEVEWLRALAALEESKDALIAAVKAAGKDNRHFETVEGVLQHVAYHAGQIRILRELLAAQ